MTNGKTVRVRGHTRRIGRRRVRIRPHRRRKPKITWRRLTRW